MDFSEKRRYTKWFLSLLYKNAGLQKVYSSWPTNRQFSITNTAVVRTNTTVFLYRVIKKSLCT